MRTPFCMNAFRLRLRLRSGIPLVYVQRMRRLLIEVYKCYNKLNPSYMHTFLNRKIIHMEDSLEMIY